MKAVHSEVLAVPRINPGETLRKAREGRGWTIAEVAAQLNLTPQRLSQVEQGAFDKLPGHTFARGYVRAYAKLLEVDQNRLVLEFDQFTGSDAAGSSVHSLGRIEEPVSYSQRILRMVSFVLLLALAGFSFFWWQEQAERRAGDLASTSLEHVEVDGADGTTQIHPLDEPEDQAVEAAQLDTEAALPLLPEATAVTSQPEQLQALVETASVPVAPATPANAVPVVAEAVSATPVATAPVQAAAGEALVSLTFIADCWTQLTDANGKVLFSALKRKGDSLQLVGKAPLELRLGYARGVQVSLNGNPVDVAPFISGETARLKLGGQ
ncbi:MAG: helix-turn-helix domain-containing protein [Pseudomonas sp.]|uniref:RodZ domain-containing protein n=1 Tax=Pseudomonas sp. TaxID=306 RepID=UPI002727582A|nr:RodZ family helix-turn-helix domain-containing protein [Pseudomonas sp.]MDO9616933.1 helix-turn-helix domain-containing protein [Pseudomonas sp.]MDP2446539.1 helix-turn-helix domain-containing protein [Pseudomonas sp.]MDZ4332495.1 RodZ family helix-turn-helix domain-containing protein [Pseudomonas sp.]